nr:hypothetical protein [Tanacetum cinerariifolium]
MRSNITLHLVRFELPFDLKIPSLEDDSIFDFSSDDKDDGVVADMNNLDTTIQVSPTLTTRIHRDHSLDHVIGDLQSATQTRKMSKNLEEHGFKKLCITFERLMNEKFQMSSMGELTFFLGLQVKQKKDGIFISQDKYVAKILKKFRFTKVKTASTSIETQKPLPKNEDGEEVDVYMYRCLKGQPKLGLWYPKDYPFDLVAYTDSDYARACLDRKSTIGGKAKKRVRLMMEKLFGMELEFMLFWSTVMAKTINGEAQLHALVDGKEIIVTESSIRRDLRLVDEEGIDCLPNSTIFKQLKLMGKPKNDTQVPHPSDPIENVPDEAVHKELGDSLFPKTKFSRWSLVPRNHRGTTAQTRIESVSKHYNCSLLARGNTLQIDEDSLKLDELMALCTTLQNMVLDSEKTTTIQRNKIASLKRRVKKLEKKNRSRTHRLKRLYKGRIDDIDADEEITLVSDQDEVVSNDADKEMFDVDVLDTEKVFVAEHEVVVKGVNDEVNVVKEVVDAINTAKLTIDAAGDIVSTASVATTVSTATTTTATITTVGDINLAQSLKEIKSTKPKEKGIVIQELGKSTTKKIFTTITGQRLAREKAKKVKEANIALIETWDDIQANIDVDHQLAERMKAQEQEELSISEKATLFQ